MYRMILFSVFLALLACCSVSAVHNYFTVIVPQFMDGKFGVVMHSIPEDRSCFWSDAKDWSTFKAYPESDQLFHYWLDEMSKMDNQLPTTKFKENFICADYLPDATLITFQYDTEVRGQAVTMQVNALCHWRDEFTADTFIAFIKDADRMGRLQTAESPELGTYSLSEQYMRATLRSSDINEHLPTHLELAQQCSSVVEIGVRDMQSTWGLLHGLPTGGRYIGIDICLPPHNPITKARLLAEEKGISFNFIARNDMLIDPWREIGAVDMIFFDALHTYCHLLYELETFSPLARKFLTFHDSSGPWERTDDFAYSGDYSEYPAHYDSSKRGVWTAIEDFLVMHPEWRLKKRYTNNFGFTILERDDFAN